MKVKLLIFNWFQCGSVVDRDGAGEDMTRYTVGDKNVISIEENEPRHGNQVWNYLVHFEDGRAVRVFNPNHVEYFPVEENIHKNTECLHHHKIGCEECFSTPEFPKDKENV